MTQVESQSKGLVLVADQQLSFAQACAQMIALHGYEVETTTNPIDLIRNIGNRQFDLLILDQDWTPSHTIGISILDQILAVDPLLPVVLMTNNVATSEAQEAIKHGAYDCLDKIAERQRILLTVRNAIDSGRIKRENRAMRSKISEQGVSGLSGGEHY